MTDQTLAGRQKMIERFGTDAPPYTERERNIIRTYEAALDAQDERIKEVERLRDIAVMNKEEGDDIHAQEYNALLARADAAEKALAEARDRIGALEEALRLWVEDHDAQTMFNRHEVVPPFSVCRCGHCNVARPLVYPARSGNFSPSPACPTEEEKS